MLELGNAVDGLADGVLQYMAEVIDTIQVQFAQAVRERDRKPAQMAYDRAADRIKKMIQQRRQHRNESMTGHGRCIAVPQETRDRVEKFLDGGDVFLNRWRQNVRQRSAVETLLFEAEDR